MRKLDRARLNPAYRYLETLSDDLLAFEFMRRGDAYRAECAAARQEDRISPEPDRGRHWGVRFPCRSGSHVIGGTGILACRRACGTCVADAGT
ncbi:transcriptional regulator domain-containing protein [Nguyenibacter vanlangensis]|uniref:transcriptional regulator domain-containing protein n=1 Tax=Nguyenibacter vanlangensis TaxID=1216886 RepID=UPI0038D0F162